MFISGVPWFLLLKLKCGKVGSLSVLMHFFLENPCTTSVWLVTGFLIELISAIMEAMIYITRYMFVQEFHFHFPLDQLTIV